MFRDKRGLCTEEGGIWIFNGQFGDMLECVSVWVREGRRGWGTNFGSFPVGTTESASAASTAASPEHTHTHTQLEMRCSEVNNPSVLLSCD